MTMNVNHPNQADKAFRFISEESVDGKKIQSVLKQYKQYKKLSQKQVVEIIKNKGYRDFTGKQHQDLWKNEWPSAADRNLHAKKYGELVYSKMWLWYEETWIKKVLKILKSTT